MELILKEDVLNLGYKNDIVKVKAGYGRNYLIPQGKAVIASESAKKMLQEELKQRAHKLAAIKQTAEELAAKIKEVKMTIVAKVSDKGTIFGSVTAAQVADEFAKQGLEVDRKVIVIKNAIKTVGNYVAHIHLHKEVTVDFPFDVVAAEETPAEA